MSEGLLTVLKLCFLALLFLFLLRVLRVVILEMRDPTPAGAVPDPVPPPKLERARRSGAAKGAELHTLEPPERAGETITVGDAEVTVGRAPGCSLVLADDTYVSQVHARFSRDHGSTIVEDLGSTNGTFVNGERIATPTKLRRGDRVQFGRTVLEVGR